MKYFDVKTGIDSEEDYTPEPEVKPENEPTENAIQVIKSNSGDKIHIYPVISVTKEIEGVQQEIGIIIKFKQCLFGSNLWYTELFCNGELVDESRSQDAFVVSAKAQKDILNFIISTLELAPQQAYEITRELISEAKKHENDILSMDETNKRMAKKEEEETEPQQALEETIVKPEDGKRGEIAEVIMKAKLHASTEEKLAELAERYGTPIDTMRDMFYNSACAINFNTAKDIKGEVKRALEKLHFTCHNKFKKQENVTLGDAGAQFLYGKIERVVISKGVDLVDVPNWEFWFDDQIDGKKIIIPATALNTMLAFDKLYLATFSRPAPILKKVDWRELLNELYEHKAKEVLDTDDSDIINVAKLFFEKICAMPITTDDIEQVVTGQALHEFKGAYFITSTKIEEIREEMKCGFTTRKINEALVRLKYKEKGTEQHWLGRKQQRCWKLSKDAVDQRNKEQDSEEM
jgi:hypothetical protein